MNLAGDTRNTKADLDSPRAQAVLASIAAALRGQRPLPTSTVGPDGDTVRRAVSDDEQQMHRDLQAGLDKPWTL